MAEALFFLLIQKIVSALGEEVGKQIHSQIEQEVRQLTQVRSRMNQIKSEFEVIQAFLSYMSTRKETDQILEAWVKQVREVAFEMEDIMDGYTYLLAYKHQQSSKSRFYNILPQSSNVGGWQHIANQLEEILNRLHHLRDMKERYGIKTLKDDSSRIDKARQQLLTEACHFIDDDELVGIKKNKRLLVQWLLDKEPQRTIISVWGMAGLGKTVLVSKVYRSKVIMANFDRHAWVSVSQTYRVEDILRRIVGEFFKDKEGVIPQHIDTMDRERLIRILHDFLQATRYLIILDDVWSTDVWTGLREILGDKNHSSRIIVTTRHHNVASLAPKNRMMKLEPLSQEEAWALFCRMAFWKDRERKCPTTLEILAKEIVNKCHGLPLAIVSIGNLLSLRGRKESEWKKVQDDINWELNNTPELDLMKGILSLSVKDLPEHLKNCFLYCGIFPEDYLIKRKKLIRLWVAEGFIKTRGRRTMEEIAEDNLNELVHRCMLQVAEINDFGRVRACKMNAIMRELALSLSEKEDFYVVSENPETVVQGEARRLSIHRCDDVQLSERSLLHLRSFILFDTVSFSQRFSFKLLRVLDMEGIHIEGLPDEVFNLLNLNYLGLRKTKIRKISKSIRRLVNLQTLDLAYTMVRNLPDGITELKKLRHLFVHTIGDQTHESFGFLNGFPAPKKLWELNCLQTLQGVEASKRLVKNLDMMTQLRTFRIIKVRRNHCVNLSTAIKKMNRIQRLDIVAADGEEALNLENMFIPPQHLRKLTLRAKLEHKVLPTWFDSLNKLTWLRLNWSGLKEDPLPLIGNLPSLVFLLLLKAYEGQILSFQAGKFPKLKDLRILDMDHLESIEIECGALTKLCQLNLVRCSSLKKVPEGIYHLNKLDILYLENMPEEFVSDLRSKIDVKREGSAHGYHSNIPNDRQDVPHIPPKITHVFQKGDGWYGESLRDPSLCDTLFQEDDIATIRGENMQREES